MNSFDFINAMCLLLLGLKPELLSENTGSNISLSFKEIACCIILSSTVGTPNSLIPPSGFGISTLRTGLGLYVPSNRLSITWLAWVSRYGRSSSTLIPSIPWLTLFFFTLLYASNMFLFVTILSSNVSVSLSDLVFSSDDADESLNTPCLFRVSNSILSSESSLYEIFCFLFMFIESFKFTNLLNVQSFLEILKHLKYYDLG